jgi:hypothetical protein
MEVADAEDDTSLRINTVRNHKSIWEMRERDSDDEWTGRFGNREKAQPRSQTAYWYSGTEAGSASERAPDMARVLGVESGSGQ